MCLGARCLELNGGDFTRQAEYLENEWEGLENSPTRGHVPARIHSHLSYTLGLGDQEETESEISELERGSGWI